MTITLNGERLELPEPRSVTELLQGLGRDPATPGVAVALNLEVLAPQDWPRVTVREGDRVDIVVAVGGG